MNNTSEPKLQAPGAGLPFPQRMALKFWFGPIVSKRTPREKARTNYEALVQKLIREVSKISPDSRKKKILVKPLRGLEDSSRYWSLNDLLEHLLIVSRATEAAILSLSAGKVPTGKADVAAVKPHGLQQDLLQEFAAYAPTLIQKLDEQLSKPGMDFSSPLQYTHPWFGPFTARQWYWLLGAHLGIHYTQAKEIIKQLAP